MFKVAITGHRSKRIQGKEKDIQNWLIEQFKILQKKFTDVMLITGMAEGVDRIAAMAALECGIAISCYFPYKHKLLGVQEYIVNNAAEVRYICDEYQEACYFKRDRRMVEDCDLLLVVWDEKPWGGTYYTYQYALWEEKDMLIFPWKKKILVKQHFDQIEDEFD